ncbi:MAG TPA: hypothetical protein PLO89_02080 [Spirochaetota bacterium]|nr:hypothetical protein [Spirochaetota bacterium]
MKRFFLSIFIFLTIFNAFSQKRSDFFRSNSNGLPLVKIDEKKRADYKFILKIDLTGDTPLLKTLYKENEESKRWEYFYVDENVLETEKYYKDKKLKEEYRYNAFGHKVKQSEFLNDELFTITVFSYNKEGLVEKEEILNLVSDKTTIVKYKYDKDFRIKQIQKTFPDNKVVFWEAFFTPKGIVTREFYTLEDEIFTFYYNQSGQEMKGEIKEINEKGEEKVKIIWENFYSYDGKRKKRIHNNFLINKKTDITYNKNFKEIKIETYYNDAIFSIESYDYNDKNLPLYYRKLLDLNLTEEYYSYNEKDEIKETKIYMDKELKKHIFYFDDKTRKEILFSHDKEEAEIFYDAEGKIIR